MDVGPLLRRARHEAGFSQRQLARAGGVTASTVSRYESGAQLPSLTVLDRLLAACDRDVRFVLTERHAGLHAEFARRAALDWRSRSGAREPLRPHFLLRLLRAGVDVLVAGEWAAELHGLPTEPADGRLLVGQEQVDVLARAFMAGFVPWREVERQFGSLPVRRETFVDNPSARFYHPDVGVFRTVVVPTGDAWPTEQRMPTDVGPLRVLAAEALTIDDGVTPEVLSAWRAWRGST